MRIAFTVLSLITFVTGSILVALSFLGNPPDPNGPNDMAEGATIVVGLIWPIILFITWLFGAAALLIERRGITALVFLGLLVGVYFALVVVLILIALLAERSGSRLPLRGLPSVLITVLFLSVDVGAAYLAWRYLRR